jgi:hypothetical protein
MKAPALFCLTALTGILLVGCGDPPTPADEARTKIAKWMKAAEQGDADAQAQLGFNYAEGKGVPEDDKEAVKWYKKAAEQGHASSQFSLGVIYSNGNGVPEDKKEAAKWYRKAAEQGHASSQYNLGVMYYEGAGVPESYVQAYAWWNIATANGNENAKEWKAELAEEMTKEQIAEAQQLSTKMVQSTPKLMGD